jgi:hypothetical protein
MGVDSKRAILQNNFPIESNSAGRAAKSAHSAPQVVGLSSSEAKEAHSNAPRSRRGPKTAAGKKAVSRNATKHAIRAFNSFVIEGFETEGQWAAYREDMFESLAPEGAFEEQLAERITGAFWRLRRVVHYETATLNRQFQETAGDIMLADAYLASGKRVPEPDEASVAALQQTRVIPAANDADKIMRYESHLHRVAMQTYHELEARQARSRGEHTSLTRLDISAPPNYGPFRSSSEPHPAEELAHAVDARVTQAERGLAARKRAARSGVPEFLAKPALERSEGDE